jgi:hypothetical protein
MYAKKRYSEKVTMKKTYVSELHVFLKIYYHSFFFLVIFSCCIFFELFHDDLLRANIYVDVYRLAMHSERTNRHKADDQVQDGAVPAYLLDREQTARAKVLSWFMLLELDVYMLGIIGFDLYL